MIIARSHIQMMVFRYQYHYSGHCVSFIQNLIKMVDVLPNLPSGLDTVILRPSDRVFEGNPRYKRQFKESSGSARIMLRLGSCIYKDTILIIDMSLVKICDERLATLPEDGDASSFQVITEDTDERPMAMAKKHSVMPVWKNLLPMHTVPVQE